MYLFCAMAVVSGQLVGDGSGGAAVDVHQGGHGLPEDVAGQLSGSPASQRVT
jgi:hypothetical protein